MLGPFEHGRYTDDLDLLPGPVNYFFLYHYDLVVLALLIGWIAKYLRGRGRHSAKADDYFSPATFSLSAVPIFSTLFMVGGPTFPYMLSPHPLWPDGLELDGGAIVWGLIMFPATPVLLLPLYWQLRELMARTRRISLRTQFAVVVGVHLINAAWLILFSNEEGYF